MKKVLILALLTLFTLGLAAQCLAADFERIEGGGVWLKTLKITNDGRYVAFATKKSFDPGDPENTWDAYRFDRDTGEYKIISNVGINQFDISDDGRYVVFVTSARLDPIDTDNLSDIYYTDLVEGTTTFASPHYAKADRFNNPNISGDGRYIAYSRSMSSHSNIFVYEIETGTITGAAYGNYRSKSYVFYPVISEDGNIVAYQKGRNIQTINMDTGAVEVIDRSNDGVAGNNTGWPVEISNDGRFVLFFSYANNLIPGVYSLSLYLRDRQEEITKRVLNNVGLHGQITSGCVSDDGKYVSFSHQARLLPEDANNLNDIYIRNMEDDSLELVSLSHDDGPTNSKSRLSCMTGDGNEVVFESAASNLIPDDPNGHVSDIFIRNYGPICKEAPYVEITSVSPDVIWPPNHKQVDITVTGSIVQPEGCILGEASVDVIDEYEEYSGFDYLEVAEDGTFSFSVQAEASRMGKDKDGREYYINVSATNEAGTSEAEAFSVVPHDMGK